MPVRNEAAFIERSLSSLLAQDYPISQVEVLVVDGMSDDGTRQTVEDFTRRFPSVHLINNPGRIVPTALNIAIRAAHGQWLIRLDAHSVYPPDYLRLCVETAQRTGADNVGGVFITLPRDDSPRARLVQAITTSRFGVGNANYRLDAAEGPADTVPFGCFRREVFAEVGLFDERLVRNQDYEFNCRLSRAGKRIWLNPAIQVKYYNQGTIAGLLGQAAFTGKWNPWMWHVAPYSFSLRHSVPVAFTLAVVAACAMSFVSPVGRIFFATLAFCYLVAAVISAFQQARRYGWWMLPLLPALFACYHAAYGLGTLWGALRLLVGATPVQRIREPWPGAGRYRAWTGKGRGKG
jgi:cellulose synthase/poly-beta-1,6-N-acetylglucosamine synthase-like glycosyltransferase